MQAIWKYELSDSAITEIEAPEGAQWLSAALQPNPGSGTNRVVAWALVDPDRPMVTHRLMGVAAGEAFEDVLKVRPLATIQVMTPHGVVVVHVSEVTL